MLDWRGHLGRSVAAIFETERLSGGNVSHFSYSPLWDDAGRLSGMLCVVTEETNRVGERLLAALRDFAAELSRSNSEAEVSSAAERCLANTQHDFPFTAVSLCPADTSSCRLMTCSGTMAGSSLAPRKIDCGSGHEVWPSLNH